MNQIIKEYQDLVFQSCIEEALILNKVIYINDNAVFENIHNKLNYSKKYSILKQTKENLKWLLQNKSKFCYLEFHKIRQKIYNKFDQLDNDIKERLERLFYQNIDSFREYLNKVICQNS